MCVCVVLLRPPLTRIDCRYSAIYAPDFLRCLTLVSGGQSWLTFDLCRRFCERFLAVGCTVLVAVVLATLLS